MSRRRFRTTLAALAVAVSALTACDITGDQLCGMVIDEAGAYDLTLTSDAICDGPGLLIDAENAGGDITVSLDLATFTVSSTGADPIGVENPFGSEAAVALEITNGTIESNDDNAFLFRSSTTMTDVNIENTNIRLTFPQVFDVTDSSFINSPIVASYDGPLNLTRTDHEGAGVSTWDTVTQLTDSHLHDVDSVALTGSVVMLRGSLHHNVIGYATGGDYTGGRFAGVDIHDNDIGIDSASFDTSARVEWSHIYNNRVGARTGAYGSFIATNSVFDNNFDHAIQGGRGLVTLTGVRVTGNGFGASGTEQFDAITSVAYSNFSAQAEFIDSTITGNAGHGYLFTAFPSFTGSIPVSLTNTDISDNGLPGCGDVAC